MRGGLIAAALLLGLASAAACVEDKGPGPSGSDAGATGGDGWSAGTGGATAVGGDGSSGGAAPESDPRTEPGAPLVLRVATFNVQNLFNDVLDDGGFGEAQELPTTAAYAEKRRRVATVIAALDADIVVLQEVENRDVLRDLAAEAALAEQAYDDLLLLTGNDPRGIDVAILGNLPFEAAVTHKRDRFSTDANPGATYSYARDCLDVTYRVRGQSLHVLGVHFKSQANDDPLKRLAEAEHTRTIADGILAGDPSAAVLIAGDFNDTPGSAPMNALEVPKPRFVSLAGSLPADESWTIRSFSSSDGVARFDDLLVSPALNARVVPGSVDVWLATEWPAGSADASDHHPVVASFEF